MAAPYTGQTISGYNSGAPADDGSIESTNEITWQKHLDKIGGPVKTLAEAMNTELLSAFGLVFGQDISVHTSDYTVVAADQGKFLSVTGTTTITLLAAATAGANFPLAIINNGTGVVTVDGSGAETINGSATITLNPGNSIILTCNGTLWVGAHDGTGSLTTTISGSAVTTMTVPGLDSSYTGGYEIDVFIRDASGTLFYIEINGDTTSGNYLGIVTLLGGSGYSRVTGNEYIFSVGVSDNGVGKIIVGQDSTSGKVVISSSVHVESGLIYEGAVTYFVTDNITSIGIRSDSPLSIDIGSFMKVKRIT